MSGIYIQGMKMPEKDDVYTLRIWGTGQVESIDGYHSFLLSGIKTIQVSLPDDVVNQGKYCKAFIDEEEVF